MYQPNMNKQIISTLYRMKQAYRIPMTKILQKLIAEAMKTVRRESVCLRCKLQRNDDCQECLLNNNKPKTGGADIEKINWREEEEILRQEAPDLFSALNQNIKRKEKNMSYMNRLQTAIDDFCEKNVKLNKTLTTEINQHIQQNTMFSKLSEDAKYIITNWEEEETNY